MTPIKLPPKYVNTPAWLIYSPAIPPKVIVTGIRIYGLAWAKICQYGPDERQDSPIQFSISMEELTAVCGIADRTLRGHLSVLTVEGVLRYAYSKRYNVYTFTLPPRSQWPQPVLDVVPDAWGEKSAEICRHLSLSVVDDLPLFSSQDQQQQISSCIVGGYGGEEEVGRNLPSSPAPDDFQARLALIDRMGIGESTRSELAGLSHSTPEYLRPWVEDAERNRGKRGPGYYVLQIRANVPPPAGYSGYTGREPVRYEDMPDVPQEGEDEPILPPPGGAAGEAEALFWAAVLGELQLQMTEVTFSTWLHGTHVLDRDGDSVIVAVKNGYAKDWLDNRLSPTIARTTARLSGKFGCECSSVIFVTQAQWRTGEWKKSENA